MAFATVIAKNREELGQKAAAGIAQALREKKEPFSILFAAAPSQNETLDALATTAGLPWHFVTAYHLDEYVGLNASAPQSFRRYVQERIIDPTGIPRFQGIRGEAPDVGEELGRYSKLLEEQFPEVGCIGIGENGHIAFNDPPDSRFDDPDLVRHVLLTRECREQQVHDGTFPDFDAVPEHAFTLSIPAILRVRQLFVMVPGARKAQAVHDTLRRGISELCPASILNTHPNATLFLDHDSASLL